MPTRHRSQTTAYGSNTREHKSIQAVSYCANEKIRSLLIRDYSFLPVTYQEPGFLFRGLEHGLTAACESGKFSLNQGKHSLAFLERELGVLLISADFSDAYTVSRLWESTNDAVILVLRANYFAARYARHEAATLGFAEPGVVFKYPFVCEDIALKDVGYFIVGDNGAARLRQSFTYESHDAEKLLEDKLIVIGKDCDEFSRQTLNEYIVQELANENVTSAAMVQAHSYPTKKPQS
ncbi:MAG: hypothetical protein ACU84Q_19865 [Gammaproteobacteria bacterium]